MAAKDNQNESQIDKTTFFWVGLCGICHPGGGPGEYDRDGEMLCDPVTGQFGYELLGKTQNDVVLDGDYSVLNTKNGALSPAPWNVTGLSEPDCLLCHRKERVFQNGTVMNWVWRAGTLRGGAALVDSDGDQVAAYAAASTAGQGWFSAFNLAATPPGKPPMADLLQIDYSVGLADGSLKKKPDGTLVLSRRSISAQPPDLSCWGCHAIADQKKRGRSWFDPTEDVHYAGFNKFTDNNPANDVAPEDSQACTVCHPSGIDHRIGKGNAILGSVDNDGDYELVKDCWDCHAADSPDKDPKAPAFTSEIHEQPEHLDSMACQFCHIPYRVNPAQLVVDNSVTGNTVGYNTDKFLSADPFDPSNGDKSRWYPSFKVKTAKDGLQKLFPTKLLLSAWWGDWDQAGTPNDLTDDVVRPTALWRLRFITGGVPLGGVTDDNNDGIMEVNTLAEINTYIQALKGNDQYGRQVAAIPVLVRGGHIYYEDPALGGNILNIPYEGTGIQVESSHPFSTDHNILPAKSALGAGGCGECHKNLAGGIDTPVFDRLILVDPFGIDGNPVYETPREMTGRAPPW